LAQASREYDVLYLQAQDFIKNSNDPEKVKELLAILDETDEDRQKLLLELGKKDKDIDNMLDKLPNQVQQQAHLGPGIVQSMKKYENVKLQNFIETLYDRQVSAETFAAEIERYFFYHSIRKTKVIQQLQEQLQDQKKAQSKLVKNQDNGKTPKEYLSSQNKHYNILYQLFVQKYNEIREDMRTRKTFTMLSNTKSLKIRTDKIEIPDLSSITIS
jgi:hypothetical protein